jgi:hypothetical protein
LCDFLLGLLKQEQKPKEEDETTSKVGFPTGRDSATFRDKGTEVPSLSRDKGTSQKSWQGTDGPGQPKFGTGQAGTAKIRDGTRDKTGQGRKGRSKTENNVLIQEKMF